MKVKDIAFINKSVCSKKDLPAEIYYLDTANLTKGHIESIQRLNKEKDKIPSRAQRKVSDKTILYSTVRPRQGHYGVLSNPPPNMLVSTGFATIDAKTEFVDPYFLYYKLISPKISEYLATIADTATSSYPSISPDDIGNIDIKLPNISEQRTIAETIRFIDQKIELNNKLVSKIESLAYLIYNYWFNQFDFPDKNGRPYKSSGGKMVWNEDLKYEIPKGWVVKSLFDVADVCYGLPLLTKKFTDSGLPVVRIRDILDNSTSAFTCQQVDDKYLTHEGDLLIGMDGNFQMNYWYQNGDCVNQRIVRIRKKEIPVMIIRFQVEPHITAKVENVARSTVGHLGDKDLKSLRIVVPEDMSILDGFDSYIKQICLLGAENRQLTSLRDFLLPLLINGQVLRKD